MNKKEFEIEILLEKLYPDIHKTLDYYLNTEYLLDEGKILQTDYDFMIMELIEKIAEGMQ